GTAIADFNGDGINDIAVACDNAGVQLFTGVGSGGVGNGQFTQSFTLGVGSAWDVAAADINGDGILDLVVSLRANSILPLLGNGSGGIGDGSFRQGSPAYVAGYPKGLALGDLDGDGILDVAVATEFGNVGVLKGGGASGVGNGTFGPAIMQTCPGSTYDVTIADFNGDHHLDIASANYAGYSMSVLLGGPGLSFQPPSTHAVSGSPLGIVSADFDTDGRPDIVLAATGGGGSFYYFHNTGPTGANPDGFTIANLYGPSRIGYGISVADLNGDHSPDVLLPDANDSFVEVAFNSCPVGGERTLTTNVVGQGSIVREPDQPTYPLEAVVQLTAIPATGWTFSNWSGDLLGSANPASVTIHTDLAVTAVFLPMQRSLTLTQTGAGQGSVTRLPNQPTYDNGSTVRLTAVPAFGSMFAGWSGDASGTANPFDLLMDGDKAVTADFEIDHSLAPHIRSVTDVPLDQGGKVKLRWSASSLETSTTNPDTMMTQYYIWREIPQSAFPAVSTGDAALYLRTTSATREYFWEFVTSLPASRFTGYSYTASTTSDSTEQGNPYTAFLVQARNAAGTRWFDSDPDSGYSVDNLAPTTPGPLAASYGAASNRLHWGPSLAPDLHGYRLHGGTDRDFVPSAANLIAEVTDTAFVDPTPRPLYYRLAAVDVHGNLSSYVLVSPETQVGVLAGDLEFALDGLVPNPSTGDRIRIQLSLPSTAPATLELL
ncbi:MAG TPA: FG-GAP-like repeat-containing protein, partial [Polyangia bacterium]|nr:FG-GAP-like repeat-containing protein [Polyangia bacterium]